MKDGEYYLISKNQIDDIVDRQVDLLVSEMKKNDQIKLQREKEKKGEFLCIVCVRVCSFPEHTKTTPKAEYKLLSTDRRAHHLSGTRCHFQRI